MAESDFYQSPVLSRKITDHIILFLLFYAVAPFLLAIFLPENTRDYPNFIINAVTLVAGYVPIIKVYSIGSFAPGLAIVVGFMTYFLMGAYGLLFAVIAFTGCNKKTCNNLKKIFPERIIDVSYGRFFSAIGLVGVVFIVFFVLPDFSWFPKSAPFGFFSGSGLSKYNLLKDLNGSFSGEPVETLFVQAYYSRLFLGLVYSIISFVWFASVYAITMSIRSIFCKLVIGVNGQ